ncbi:hypothetical protein Pdw03_1766 [Penicillium digitatum]|uniref:Uncharacterized protein n=1 Tax=Penicillium digitatum TaxID=36651 RepID=A0A7T6XSZ3_PENDI|nr:hypothetical protein PDIDSM_797 [Penicillium digitatum]QQK46868.1 hypothetical protein Pdw03_1766 [Penicillium digitatum]
MSFCKTGENRNNHPIMQERVPTFYGLRPMVYALPHVSFLLKKNLRSSEIGFNSSASIQSFNNPLALTQSTPWDWCLSGHVQPKNSELQEVASN